MNVTQLLAAAITMLPACAMAAPPCDGFEKAIEESLKEIAWVTASGVGDDSAPRETLRSMRIANELALIRLHLDLAARNQCPARRAPINEHKYLGQAAECRTEQLRGVKDPPVCKRETWIGFTLAQ